ncbi:hypothetical protein [Parendozoicomonas sp. Alg238-R29]|uniref:hypothetical protein n=1 Tax=Parendozoicomonas sp. Alg238-R29 TaxID=2993446 RepID=UPI00248E7067|nr:hypothetical protein [Parendozoicomonas sp. Alg238-R29]
MEKAAERAADIMSTTLSQVSKEVEKGRFGAVATTLADGFESSSRVMNAGLKVAGNDVRKGIEQAAQTIAQDQPSIGEKVSKVAVQVENGFRQSGLAIEKDMSSLAETTRQTGEKINQALQQPQTLVNENSWNDFESWINDLGSSVESSAQVISNGHTQTGNTLSQTFTAVSEELSPQSSPSPSTSVDTEEGVQTEEPGLGEVALYLAAQGFSKISHETKKVFNDAAQSSLEGIKTVGNHYKQGFENIGHSLKENFTQFDSHVENGVNQSVNTVGNAFSETGQKVGNSFKDAGQEIGNAFSKAGDSLKNSATMVGYGIKEGAEEVEDFFKDDIFSSFKSLHNDIKDTFNTVEQAAKKAEGKIKDVAKDVAKETEKTAEKVANEVIHKPVNKVKKFFKKIF